MTGPGGPYGFTLPAAVPGEQFGTATNGFVFASLTDCAYIITLSATLLLTTGDSAPDPIHDQMASARSSVARLNDEDGPPKSPFLAGRNRSAIETLAGHALTGRGAACRGCASPAPCSARSGSSPGSPAPARRSG